ncbi:MAG: DNA N-6-adenine-methyltransferase [Chloroflexi bacterium]|nr:DNA N-6-adenine-methyltransferase [Chloroflexota bacterium]
MRHLAQNTGRYEWYTPQWLIERVHRALGAIDLDPASSLVANEIVGATSYYTEADDALTKSWRGRVFLNPPYARKVIDAFIDHLLRQRKLGNCVEYVVLVNNATETRWAQRLLSASSDVCFLSRRVRFINPHGASGGPLQGQMVCYAGANGDRFVFAFQDVGVVADLAARDKRLKIVG